MRSPQIQVDASRYKKVGVPDTLLPTYGDDPRRPDGCRAALTPPLIQLPGCLDPRQTRGKLRMKPPVLYYGYRFTDEKMMEVTGPIEGCTSSDGEPHMGVYGFKAHSILQRELKWKCPLETVYHAGDMSRLLVLWTNYTSPEIKEQIKHHIAPLKEFLGIEEKPMWYVAAHNRWYWA